MTHQHPQQQHPLQQHSARQHEHGAPQHTHAQIAGHEPAGVTDPAEFWERRYADSGQVWSGRVNQMLANVAAEWAPGRSLDLGCGEGGDVLWLAEHGWNATGIDLSPTAVTRADAEASARGVNTARFIAADLGEWVERGAEIDGSSEQFDLITSSFMQSPVELPRQRILQAALARLAPGGRLVILTHAAPPPWAKDHPGEFLPPEGEVELLGLDLDSGDWTIEVAEVRERDASGPDGHQHHLEDTVVVVQRLA